MRDKFWMIITINGSIAVDCDDQEAPILYSEQDASARAKALSLTLGENYRVCVLEAMYSQNGKMITEKVIFQRPTTIESAEIE
ncbi:MAG: hypothetical protein IPK77_10605 [Cellvibrio sp.]|nr:hypothetical protein [Cellvibrio sp.]